MNKYIFSLLILLFSPISFSDTLPFKLSIKGANIDMTKNLELSDVGEGKDRIIIPIKDSAGKNYTLDIKYKDLPNNRSYPGNLDISFKNGESHKLSYLFFAINNLGFLKEMGEFGFITDVEGQSVDVKFVFDSNQTGNLTIDQLVNERFIQDTLVSKFNFQMIRPVILPRLNPSTRSQTYQLDKHPYAVNFTLKNTKHNSVQFQHNLYAINNEQQQLLQRIYFHAGSVSALREAMYAGKYFHQDDGAFKLVFYPALGQTEPQLN